MPCSPGMSACKSSCLHRSFVQDYRAERARQLFNVVEGNLGYTTEINAELVRLRENGTPLIDFKSHLIMTARPPGDRQMADPDIRGNAIAEKQLLSAAMKYPAAVKVLRQLDSGEFIGSVLNQEVAKVILTLEDNGQRATPLAVQEALRKTGYMVPRIEWDSTIPLSAERQKTAGLRGWEAPPLREVQYLAAEVRQQFVANATERIHEWAADMLSGARHSTDGPSPEFTELVKVSVQEKLDSRPPLLSVRPSEPAHRINALDYSRGWALSTGPHIAINHSLTK